MSRVVGVMAAFAGLAVTLIMWLFPVHVQIVGTGVSCGPPVVVSVAALIDDGVELDPVSAAVWSECVRESTVRVAIGAGVGGLALVAAVVVFMVGEPRRPAAAVLTPGQLVGVSYWR